MSEPIIKRTSNTKIIKVEDNNIHQLSDKLTTEEPMEIRVLIYQQEQWKKYSIAVTMRTPGHDFELAAGFLLSEGMIEEKDQIAKISHCTQSQDPQNYNIVTVRLREWVDIDISRFIRNVYTTSSCGVCGKASLDLLKINCKQNPIGDFQLPTQFFNKLPGILQKSQTLFTKTGGLHACALFNSSGQLLLVREDVGRHNALDKLIGHTLLYENTTTSNAILLLSGRASFELLQKAVVAGIPVVAAIGAPSSLAVQIAQNYNMTLIGFLRNNTYNIYSGEHRILMP